MCIATGSRRPRCAPAHADGADRLQADSNQSAAQRLSVGGRQGGDHALPGGGSKLIRRTLGSVLQAEGCSTTSLATDIWRVSSPGHELPPAHDRAAEGVDHEGQVDEPRPGADRGEIGHEPVRCLALGSSGRPDRRAAHRGRRAPWCASADPAPPDSGFASAGPPRSRPTRMASGSAGARPSRSRRRRRSPSAHARSRRSAPRRAARGPSSACMPAYCSLTDDRHVCPTHSRLGLLEQLDDEVTSVDDVVH